MVELQKMRYDFKGRVKLGLFPFSFTYYLSQTASDHNRFYYDNRRNIVYHRKEIMDKIHIIDNYYIYVKFFIK